MKKKDGLYYDEENDYYWIYDEGCIRQGYAPEEFAIIRNAEVQVIEKGE